MASPSRFKKVPRGPARFNEREIARAIRAARRAGGVVRMDVDVTPSGHTIQYVLGGEERPTTNTDPNPWDEVHAADKERPA